MRDEIRRRAVLDERVDLHRGQDGAKALLARQLAKAIVVSQLVRNRIETADFRRASRA